jgi:hypothetical protein
LAGLGRAQLYFAKRETRLGEQIVVVDHLCSQHESVSAQDRVDTLGGDTDVCEGDCPLDHERRNYWRMSFESLSSFLQS